MPDYRQAAVQIAKKYGIDPGIFTRQINAESGFNPRAHSPAGANGIAQFIPSTARQYHVDVNDPISSLDGAARLMRDSLKANGGSYAKALSVYNSGRPDGYLHIAETRNYVAKILRGANPVSTPTASPQTSVAPSVSAKTVSTPATPGVDNGPARAQLALQFLSRRDQNPVDFALGIRALADVPGIAAKTTTTSTTTGGRPPAGGRAPAGGSNSAAFTTPPTESGVASFEGRKVAAWIAPALAYARQHGWKGQVNSGFRSFADQTRIYNSGVRPAARPGTSNHEGTQFPRGAIDVSDAQALSNILLRSPYAKRLVFAGAKDPVHFSHPHGGSY